MVFPSLFARVEPGMISQGSIYIVIAFSFFLYYWKRLIAIFAVLFSISIIAYYSTAHAIGYVPGGCGTLCMANNNYYGTPYGGYGFYPYSSLPFHSLYGPSNYYFQPYAPSPYQPQDCYVCMQRYNMYTSPISSSGITQNGSSIPQLVQLRN
ncbi:MAG: hypothetical protein K2Q18_01900 [Bdellovibrionales bacterium]|nr:hypothetical protein [Bdellovibrionales bacterium]